MNVIAIDVKLSIILYRMNFAETRLQTHPSQSYAHNYKAGYRLTAVSRDKPQEDQNEN